MPHHSMDGVYFTLSQTVSSMLTINRHPRTHGTMVKAKVGGGAQSTATLALMIKHNLKFELVRVLVHLTPLRLGECPTFGGQFKMRGVA